MRRNTVIYLLLSALLASACTGMQDNPYGDTLNSLFVNVIWPEGSEEYIRSGVEVQIEDALSGTIYTAYTDSTGIAGTNVPTGVYRASVSDITESYIFNGVTDKFAVNSGEVTVDINLEYSIRGVIVIKEIYCGGCSKYPAEGTYQSDKYIILHNNSAEVQYLDSLCFGTLAPYNSQATKIMWNEDGTLPDFVPIVQALWTFGGDGDSFPLQPGEDAVLVVCGAIDHTVSYPLSVNLNKADYFVCYNETYFTNTNYHPAPGDQIQTDRYLDVVIKTGQANAYTFSVYSPATVIFRAVGQSIKTFCADSDNVMQVPGSTVDRVVKIPPEWVVDAVEVFTGTSSSNNKRFIASLDAGYVTLTELYKGHTLMRYTDEEETAFAGYEVLVDTNNSSYDFYERETQSLHED